MSTETNQNIEGTREEIETKYLPVDHPDVIALSEHIQSAHEIAKRNGWPSIMIAFSSIEDNGRNGTMGAICSTISPETVLRTCKGFGIPKGIHIAASMIDADKAVDTIRKNLETRSSASGHSIAGALAALRPEEATTDASTGEAQAISPALDTDSGAQA
jgi:hypothetical protein